MVQLSAIRGQHSGARFIVERFPFSIGRHSADLVCDDRGVWENHIKLHFEPGTGIVLQALPEAFTAVNGVRLSSATLRNGDVLELGDCKFQFTLAPARQSSLGGWEMSAWFSLFAITVAQIVIIYALLNA
jgi:pSer/pThr/pTyr-binding forkhead associated (FHA) protein